MISLLLISSFIMTITGCGVKGPLYFPTQVETPQVQK